MTGKDMSPAEKETYVKGILKQLRDIRSMKSQMSPEEWEEVVKETYEGAVQQGLFSKGTFTFKEVLDLIENPKYY